jgi:3-methyl-2-oxobutanoate hydroxymethyltransferase
VQCHGNRYTAPFIAAIVRSGIPVLAHLGLQSVRKTEQSGYGVKGRDAAEAEKIVADALALVDAGVFAILLELVPEEITKYLSARLNVPVFSLGSGQGGDGVYLVSADLTGYGVSRKPSTAGDFVDVRPIIEKALRSYLFKARTRVYPQASLSHHMSKEEIRRFRSLVRNHSNTDAKKRKKR